MGYDLHITRREFWSYNGDDITASEWLAVVAQDPELQLDKENGPYFVTRKQESSANPSWLNWSNGQIYSKNPDDALIDKMVSIAKKLNARVQGDEGEFYKSSKDAHRVPNKRGEKYVIKQKFGKLILFMYIWGKRIESYTKKDWTINDYPIQILTMRLLPQNTINYAVMIHNWPGMIGRGTTTKSAKESLSEKLMLYKKEHGKLPRPGLKYRKHLTV
jgi:hypothetical protein